MRALGVMVAKDSESFRRGNEIVVRSNRGIETGLVLCEATDDALAHLDQPPVGHILREMTDDDARELAHLEESRDDKLARCQKHVDSLELVMQLVELEQLLGGERIVVYYLAEDRVDFRELVKLLAGEFQTRIEMKQIGVRDEAKILADYGDCGRPVCCNTHLSKMPPVSMRMAKIQKATLDPTKISGRCGRLKCCLRYEFDTYDEIQKQLPKVGSHIVTREGRARVIGQEILAEQLLVETEDNRRILIDASEVLSIIKKGSPEDTGGKPKSDRSSRRNDRRSNDQRNKPDVGKKPAVEQRSEKKPKRTDKQQQSDGKPSSPIENSSKGDKKRKRKRRRPRKRKPRSDDSNGGSGENPDNKN